MEIPTNGASSMNMTPWMTAREVPPISCPKTKADRGIGATSTAWRNPSFLSSIIEIVEKIEVNSNTSNTVPGKKYSM